MDVISFVQDMKNGESQFDLCPDIVYTESLVLKNPTSLSSLILISCSDPNDHCTWKVNGGSHIVYEGNNTISLSIRGILFLGSTKTSLRLYGDSISSFVIERCIWKGNEGRAVVDISRRKKRGKRLHELKRALLLGRKRDRFRSKKILGESREVGLNINECRFYGNTVTHFLILSELPAIVINRNDFEGNKARKGIVRVMYGIASIESSTFKENRVTESGIIYVDDGAQIKTTNVCGVRNVAKTFCNGTLFSASLKDNCREENTPVQCKHKCVPLHECTSAWCATSESYRSDVLNIDGDNDLCTSSKSDLNLEESSYEMAKCYDVSTWDMLFDSIRESKGNEVFTLCEHTVVNMNIMEKRGKAPLIVQQNNITIQCRSSGQGNCILLGGTSHVHLLKKAKWVRIVGITMVEASKSSILLNTTDPFFLLFEDCTWKHNAGVSAIYIPGKVKSSNKFKEGIEPESAIEASLGLESLVVDDERNIPRRAMIQTKRLFSLTRNDALDHFREIRSKIDPSNHLSCYRCLFYANNFSKSVISAYGVSMNLKSVVFRNNRLGESVIGLDMSSLKLENSCLEENEFADALIYSNYSEVTTDEVYISTEGISQCKGLLKSDGSCITFESSKICRAYDTRCYSKWNDLHYAVSSSSKGQNFSICEGAKLDVANYLPIVINKTNTFIKCGVLGTANAGCAIKGGIVQFQISGNVQNIQFSGITFTNASIAFIKAMGGRKAKAHIFDCTFQNMKQGQAALMILPPDSPKTVDAYNVSLEDYNDTSTQSMTVEVLNCRFLKNDVDLAPVVNVYGKALISNCEFRQNKGYVGAIGQWFGGTISLSKSCLINNSGQIAGAVLAEGDNFYQEENFGSGNIGANVNCSDWYQTKSIDSNMSKSGKCVLFSRSICQLQGYSSLSPTLPPSDSESSSGNLGDGCIRKLSDLEKVLSNSSLIGTDSVFTLCKGSVFELNESKPIRLSKKNSKLRIQCGKMGRVRGNCVFKGGKYQFQIISSRISVAFYGVTFRSSTVMSILASADSNSVATFIGCKWEGHSGQGVLLVYNEKSNEKYHERIPIHLLPFSEHSMNVSIIDSEFVENPITYAVINVVGGKTWLEKTAFLNNQNAFAAAIYARARAQVFLQQCCFIQNDSELPGVVLMTEESQVSLNSANFAYDNRIKIGITNCTDIWTSNPFETCSLISCLGTCTSFSEDKCRIPSYDFEVPSISPSTIATALPISPPATFVPDINISLALKETSIFSSFYFLINFIVLGLAVFIFSAVYLRCKKQYSRKACVPLQNFSIEDLAMDDQQHTNEVTHGIMQYHVMEGFYKPETKSQNQKESVLLGKTDSNLLNLPGGNSSSVTDLHKPINTSQHAVNTSISHVSPAKQDRNCLHDNGFDSHCGVILDPDFFMKKGKSRKKLDSFFSPFR
jgi:hypothetical protein